MKRMLHLYKIFIVVALLTVKATNFLIAQDIKRFDGIEFSKNYKAARNSSTDSDWVNGNIDFRPVPAGKTLVLADLKGPGRITHIWFTFPPFTNQYGEKLVLKIYWDNELYPSVEAPVNDFFCQGHGIDVDVKCLPFDVSKEGKSRNCYFPMPFRKSARIEITNESDEDLKKCYWQIDWQRLDGLSKKTMYFHAKYCQAFPCKSEDGNYLILEAKGRGHYVGTNLSVRSRTPGWWGEGDDRFYVDGEEYPSVMGTGAEDYFGQAWGISEYNGLFYGCPFFEKRATYPLVSCYRFHFPDPIPFDKSLKVTIEHKGVKKTPEGKGIYGVREDDYSSVAYWYQTEPHFEFEPLPSLKKRLYPNNVIFIEGEMLGKTNEAVGAHPKLQIFQDASKGQFLSFSPFDGEASLSVKFSVQQTLSYDTWLHMIKSWDYGIYQVFLDGKAIKGPIDNYNDSNMQSASINLGRLSISGEEHTLKFVCVGKNPSSKGYSLGLDMIELMPMQE